MTEQARIWVLCELQLLPDVDRDHVVDDDVDDGRLQLGDVVEQADAGVRLAGLLAGQHAVMNLRPARGRA